MLDRHDAAPKRFLRTLASLILGASCAVLILPQGMVKAAPQEPENARMQWWRDAKFGMFIHWGLYAIPAGEWNGRKVPGIGEWIMHRGKIPKEEYAKLQQQFNPTKYDPQQWVSIAKQAGVKYIVITSKHHDGFCLFDSKLTDYDMTGTPYGKDLLKPLADACHAEGIKICWYHSIMDWHHPEAHSEKYFEHMRGQLDELLTNYGEIGVLWFDGEWIDEWTAEKGAELERQLRNKQPQLIVNNRVGKRKRSPGDFGTPEQHIPATGTPGWDWETCMTMNNTWGYKKDDHNWKSTKDLVQKLVDIVSKGGNFLLNVGPTAEGEIPAPSVTRLKEIGQWMAVNEASIYGTTASPFKRLTWGRCTQKPGTLYLHVFDWPQNQQLLVPALQNDVSKAYLLCDPERNELATQRVDGNIIVRLPQQAPDPWDSVVVLQIAGEPVVTQADIQQADDRTITLLARDADTHGDRIQYESGNGKDNIGFWTDPKDWVSWVCRVTKPGTFNVEIHYACTNPGGTRFVVEVGDNKIEGRTEATGSWSTFKTFPLGSISLSEERHILSVKAQDLHGEAVMNLQSVVLRPAE
jgi:alpha-L-fucosidase